MTWTSHMLPIHMNEKVPISYTHTHTHIYNHLTALYPQRPRSAGIRTLKNIKTIYQSYWP